MSKTLKRWLALFLVVALMATSAIYSTGTSLKATGDESVEQYNQEAEAGTGTEGGGQVDGNAQIPDAVNQGTGDTQATEEIVLEPPTEENNDDSDKPADAEQKYNVIFTSSNTEAGVLAVWSEGSEMKNVSLDGGKYTEEVTEGVQLNFRITIYDKYTVQGVKDETGTEINAVSSDGNIYTYQITVSGEKQISISYKEVIQEKAEEPKPEADKKVTEGPKTEAVKKAEDKSKSENDKKTVDNPMPEADKKVTEEPKTEDSEKVKHKFTVKFEDEDGAAISDDFTASYEEGGEYSVEVSPKDGYTAHLKDADGEIVEDYKVTGKMETEDIELHIIYVKDKEKEEAGQKKGRAASIESISIKGDSHEAAIGGNGLKLTVETSLKDTEGLKWESANPDVAEVSSDGTVTAKSVGKTMITAAIGKVKSEEFAVEVYKPVTITFHANKGSGTVESISAKPGSTIVLPEADGIITRTDHQFMGWSDTADSSGVTNWEGEAIRQILYQPGSPFVVPEKNQTLYAGWGFVGKQEWGALVVAIRTDGKLPSEPAVIPDTGQYKYIINNIDTNLAAWFSPVHTAIGSENVTPMLKSRFFEEVNMLNSVRHYWDEKTQYVEWYVIKDQRTDWQWHIDGVVRTISKAHLDYNPNCTDYRGLAPDGDEYDSGAVIKVADQNTLQRPGYDFVGWNTLSNGKGTAYQPKDDITLNGNIVLYAQWEQKSGVVMTYKSETGGRVTLDKETINPETGTPKGSEAAADEGYTFVGWFVDSIAVSDELTLKPDTVTKIAKKSGEYKSTTFIARWSTEKRKVKYTWSGLPENTRLYDKDGKEVKPALPGSIEGLIIKEEYTVDKKMPGTKVYTKDAFGNNDREYTLSEWNDPGKGVMGPEDITIKGTWTFRSIPVSKWNITYEWSGDVPKDGYLQELPIDNKEYSNNEPYTVDTKYTKNYSVNTTDKYGNVNGVYTFNGWNLENGKITENLTIKGEWKFSKTDVRTYKVIYSWKGLPENKTFYDKDGEVETVTLPETITNLVKKQDYKIDKTMEGKVVYTHDQYGNIDAKYTFGDWNDPNNGKMGEADVPVTGSWTPEAVPVQTWNIRYKWENAPVSLTDKLPKDTKTYTNGETYAVENTYVKGYKVNDFDAYENVKGVYTFSGWNPKEGTITSNLTIEGTWTYKTETIPKYNVDYQWTGLPQEDLYNEIGNKVEPQTPAAITGLVKGQSYGDIDDSMPGKVVYTHDAYGNKNAKYTLGEWDVPNNAVMDESNETIWGTWSRAEVGVQTWNITYSWDGDVPTDEYAQTPPKDDKDYVNNSSYIVDKTFSKDTAITTYDKYNNVTGNYVFSGWSVGDGSIKENLEIKGTWTYKTEKVERHNVTYEWNGLPSEPLYDIAGNEMSISVPAGHTGLVKNQDYTLDITIPGMTVYTHDQYKNINGSYTFPGWTDSGNGKMGDKDIVITGVWSYENVPVDTWNIKYSWGGVLPTEEIQTLPSDNTAYVNGQSFSVDETFTAGYSVPAHDQYGNVKGVHTFSGWDTVSGTITGNLLIQGTWRYIETDIAKYNVDYQWKNLPGQTMYDAAGKEAVLQTPPSITGLVKNQKYTPEVDTSKPGTVVYTHDEYGNRNGKYTLGDWVIPNDGIMGESDDTIWGTWNYEPIEVAAWNITYEWNGEVPSGEYERVLPTDTADYTDNSPYTVNAVYTAGYSIPTYDGFGNPDGNYIFSGWDTKNGRITSQLTIKGTWTYTETELARNNVTYSWNGLPGGTAFYDIAGNVINPQLPESITGLVKNQRYTVDAGLPGMVVFTHDSYGNINGVYTLGRWQDSGNGVMQGSDIVITAAWSAEARHTLVIHYVNNTGAAVADDYTGTYLAGEAFAIDSPVITGYTPAFTRVNSGADGMPAQDVEVTVIYTPAAAIPSAQEDNTTPGAAVTPQDDAATAPVAPAVDGAAPAPLGAPADTTAVTAQEGTAAVTAPVEAEVTQNEEGGYTLTPIADEETPLANRNLDEHECCILHFLLMLLALIVLGFYTSGLKKRQARIFELREEYELEVTRRSLKEEEEETEE